MKMRSFRVGNTSTGSIVSLDSNVLFRPTFRYIKVFLAKNSSPREMFAKCISDF